MEREFLVRLSAHLVDPIFDELAPHHRPAFQVCNASPPVLHLAKAVYEGDLKAVKHAVEHNHVDASELVDLRTKERYWGWKMNTWTSVERHGISMLMLAAARGHVAVAQYLVEECRVPTNVLEISGGDDPVPIASVLHYALESKSLAMLRYLHQDAKCTASPPVVALDQMAERKASRLSRAVSSSVDRSHLNWDQTAIDAFLEKLLIREAARFGSADVLRFVCEEVCPKWGALVVDPSLSSPEQEPTLPPLPNTDAPSDKLVALTADSIEMEEKRSAHTPPLPAPPTRQPSGQRRHSSAADISCAPLGWSGMQVYEVLEAAALSGQIDSVKFVMSTTWPLPPVSRDVQDQVMFAAARSGSVDIVKLLVTEYKESFRPLATFSPRSNTVQPLTLLHFAALSGSAPLVRYLAGEHQLNVHAKWVDKPRGRQYNDMDLGLVHLAAFAGSVELIKCLEELGVQCDEITSNGQSALWFAAHGGSVDTVQYLIETAGMDPCAVSPYAGSAVDIAHTMCHYDTVLYLIRQGGSFTLPHVGIGDDMRFWKDTIKWSYNELGKCPVSSSFFATIRRARGRIRGVAPPPSATHAVKFALLYSNEPAIEFYKMYSSDYYIYFNGAEELFAEDVQDILEHPFPLAACILLRTFIAGMVEQSATLSDVLERFADELGQLELRIWEQRVASLRTSMPTVGPHSLYISLNAILETPIDRKGNTILGIALQSRDVYLLSNKEVESILNWAYRNDFNSNRWRYVLDYVATKVGMSHTNRNKNDEETFRLSVWISYLEAVSYLCVWVTLGVLATERRDVNAPIGRLESFVVMWAVGLAIAEWIQLWGLGLQAYFTDGNNFFDTATYLSIAAVIFTRAYSWSPEDLENADLVYTVFVVFTLLLVGARWLIFGAFSRTLGTLLLSIRRMIEDVLLFSVLQLLILVSFFLCFWFIAGNSDLPNFDSMWSLWIWLYQTAVSSESPVGDPADVSLSFPREVLLQVLSSLFLLMNGVLLLNLLIAKMATTYQRIEDNARSEYLILRLQFMRSYTDAPFTLPSPLNLVVLVLFPFAYAGAKLFWSMRGHPCYLCAHCGLQLWHEPTVGTHGQSAHTHSHNESVDKRLGAAPQGALVHIASKLRVSTRQRAELLAMTCPRCWRVRASASPAVYVTEQITEWTLLTPLFVVGLCGMMVAGTVFLVFACLSMLGVRSRQQTSDRTDFPPVVVDTDEDASASGVDAPDIEDAAAQAYRRGSQLSAQAAAQMNAAKQKWRRRLLVHTTCSAPDWKRFVDAAQLPEIDNLPS